MAASGAIPADRRRKLPRRSDMLVGAGILAVFAAAAVNAPQHVRETEWANRDRQAFSSWVAVHGGRRSYGASLHETHQRYDAICAIHYRGGRPHGADYELRLLVDSHGAGAPRVVRAVHAPLRSKQPTGCDIRPPAR